MFKWLNKLLTKNYSKIPLFWVEFNLNKYNKDGAKNSCVLKTHPELSNDKHVINTLENLIDYIRDNYDMKKLSK